MCIKTSTTTGNIGVIQRINHVHPFKSTIPCSSPKDLTPPFDIRICFDRDMAIIIYTCELAVEFWEQYEDKIENYLEKHGNLDLLTNSANENWKGIESWRLILEYWLITPHEQVSGYAYFKADGIPIENYEYEEGINVKVASRNELASELFPWLVAEQKEQKKGNECFVVQTF